MSELFSSITTILVGGVLGLVGGVLGFGLNWFLAERQERYELRRSIAQMRAEAYKSLWVLCKKDLKPDEVAAREEALLDWYNSEGGGLFLSLAASKRFIDARELMEEARKLMKEKKPTETVLKDIEANLSWLRTEMKYHVGSYTRREKNTKIHDAS